jgi:hypothetical protein
VYESLDEPRPFRIPVAHSEPSKGEYALVVAKWQNNQITNTLMKDKDTFVVAVVDPLGPNPGYATYYEHPDLAILRAYLHEAGVLIPADIGNE